jgi:hypothetical protein
MSLALNFYHDQRGEDGGTSVALPPAHRILYVRHGRAEVNGRMMNADEGRYCDEPVALRSSVAWCEIWRWELALPNAPVTLHEGAGVLSLPKMRRIIAYFSMLNGTHWLFRLDRIITPAGGIADRHQHPGPGIRCLLEETFNVHQAAESHRDLMPGDPWWEAQCHSAHPRGEGH